MQRSNEMWWFLVLLGLLIAVAGLAVVAIGISIFVTTFGNALVTTGAVAASGGFIIIAMGLVLRQLERLNQRLEDLVSKRQFELSDSGSEDEPRFIAPAPQMAPEPAASVEDKPVQFEASRTQEEAEQENDAPQASSRLPPYLRARATRTTESENDAAKEPASAAEMEAPSPSTAESDAERSPEPQLRPSRTMEPPPVRLSVNSAESDSEENAEAEPRILKSGIVGGMAYTLYSDGSIQADLPDGVVRFSSLHELRDHVAKAQNR
ncbi:hypothetical protein ACT6QH_09230 [Xanthobacter sp. TB0139]|uniref:hypothetical protein n=1 Tax=Xanthobacter sp. TB0139 TaxID=3459178 RepID=UPI0040394FBE